MRWILALCLACLPVWMEGSADAAGTEMIRAAKGNLCVANQGNKAVLAPCDSANPAQHWIFLLNGEIRPKNAITRCLDVAGGKIRNRRKIILWRCHGGRNQRWSDGKRDRLKVGRKCLDVNAQRFRSGEQLQVYRCNRTVAQRFGSFRWGAVTNAQLADLGFPAMQLCRDSSALTEAQGKCYMAYRPPQGVPPITSAKDMNAENIGAFITWLAGQRYGFRTGGGGDWRPTGSDSLDLGQRYSIDRCSLHHDRHHWGDGDPCINDAAMVRCFKRVEPVNIQENIAQAAVLASSKVLLDFYLLRAAVSKDCKGRLLKKADGELPPR